MYLRAICYSLKVCRKHFRYGRDLYPVQKSGYVTVLPEFLECYLLLCAAGSGKCFHFKNNAFPSSSFIDRLYLECRHCNTEPKLTAHVPLRTAVTSVLPDKVLFVKAELLVDSIFAT
jgi:hypothetical protein